MKRINESACLLHSSRQQKKKTKNTPQNLETHEKNAKPDKF